MRQEIELSERTALMNVKRIIRRMTDNDYLFTIFTKIMAVFIGLIASFYSNRFLGPELKGQLGRISSMLSIVAVTANFGLYQPYPYYKRQDEADVLNKFLRIFLLQFIAYTVIGVIGAVCFHSFELTAVCLLAPIQVLANQLSFMMMVEDVKFKNAIFFTARITNTLITIIAFYTMDRTILVALALIVVGDVITVVMALMRMKRFPNPLKADLRFAAKIVPFGFVSMITTLMLTLNYRVDTLMMGYMYHIPDAEIGFYSLGVSLSEYGWLIPDAFREVLFSRTAKDDAIEEVTMSMKINFYLTLVMIAGILLLGRPGDSDSRGRGISACLSGDSAADCGHHSDELFQNHRYAASGAGQKGRVFGHAQRIGRRQHSLQHDYDPAVGQDGRGDGVGRFLCGGGFCVPGLLPENVSDSAERGVCIQPE